MTPVVVVGSGASAVHFAQSLLEKGQGVLMLDVGRQQPALPRPDDSLNELKRNLSDPIGYFLGERFESVVYPDQEGEYYGFPPGKDYVFAGIDQFQLTSRGFTPLSSFARGGLAEAWTAGVYPLNEAELEHYPVSLDEMTPYYDLVAQRIGITGEPDDLSRFMPVHDHLMTPLDLDEHSQTLLRSYLRKKRRLNERYRCFVGRSRLATLSADANGRKGCRYLGRCLWGCPTESLYTPVVTLRHCMQFPKFQYLPGQYVTHFELDRARRVTAVVAETLDDRTTRRFEVDRLVLAAGTLSSCKIILDSVFRHSGERVVLRGLMDNRQILMPFLNLHMVGQQFNPDSYQYQQLALGLEGTSATDYVHGQITTLTTALIHPLVQQLPLDFRSALSVFRNVHAALGLINAMFCDTRRDDNCVTLGGDPSHARSTLVVEYSPPPGEQRRIAAATKTLRRVLWQLGCVVPPGMSHVRPMGASVHYAGLIPMSPNRGQWTTSKYCQSHDFENLFIIDGTTFPFLPAKQLTFTLMANAARVADQAF